MCLKMCILIKKFLDDSFSSNVQNNNTNKVWNNSIALYKYRKPYTLVGFEPTIFCSGGTIFNFRYLIEHSVER
jgi:hypothetical protein